MTTATVFVVDDDPSICRALVRLLRVAGLDARAFPSAAAFLGAHDAAAPGCLVLDLAMPELDGMGLQQILAATDCPRPIVFLTGHGDIPTSVRAMKGGAVDFLTKPVDAMALLTAVQGALERDRAAREAWGELEIYKRHLASLTPREREVLEHVVAGRLNKQIAADLGTVEKTVKVHRGRIMQKMAARSLADLVRIASRLGIDPRPAASPPRSTEGDTAS